MASIILSKRQLLKDILKQRPLFKDPKNEVDKLSSELHKIDLQIREAQFNLRHGNFKEVTEAQNTLRKIQPEYARKSEELSALSRLLETEQSFGAFKRLCKEGKIIVACGTSAFGTSDHYQQQQQLSGDLHFRFKFLCGHERSFDLSDLLDLSSLRMLVSTKCEIQLGALECGKDCRRGGTLAFYIHRIV